MPAYEIRKCPAPGCGLRYPLPCGHRLGERCPRCRSLTHLVHTIALAEPADELPPGQPAAAASETMAWLAALEADRPAGRLPQFAALLDNLRSAWNVGSMFRTAEGLGFSGLVLGGISPTPENPRVRRTALGAEQSLAWRHFPDALEAAQEFQRRGWSIWALETGPQALPLESNPPLDRGGRVLLVVGSELYGVDPDLLALCERVLAIPMSGRKRSFNAAVAFGIAAYQLWRQAAG